jgi:hypothetical protein
MTDDELEKLLESISTANPALRVRGVVKTPNVEGKLSKGGEVLPGGVSESELPPPLLGKPKARVNLLRIPWYRSSVQDKNAPMTEPQKKIYLDDIERYKKANIKAPYKKLVSLINSIPVREVTNAMVKTLKMRLRRRSRAK